jgi:hypothetical protein
MRHLLAVTVLSAATLFAADEPVLEPLFNGTDFTGWDSPAENPWWTIAGGVLTGQNDAKLKGNTLWTKKSYGDCVVEAQARWSGEIDSGIFVREKGKWQCQIGVSRSLKKDMTCSVYAGGKYPEALQAKDAEKLIKPGDWNLIRIEAKGDHFKIWLNGQLVVDADFPGYNKPGPIGLQIHPGLKMKVEFKDIKAAELK